jgi:signal transduction histidine kinase
MESKLNPYIIELESKILILERENEALSAKAEENLLLNRAFEEINNYDDICSLLLNTLESITVLLNIQFAGVFDLINDKFVCISSYSLFSNEDTIEVNFELPSIYLTKIKSSQITHLKDDTIVFHYPNSNFKIDNLVIAAIDSEINSNRYFVFVNDENNQDLKVRVPILEKIIRIISAKLERIFYQNELKNLNSELEKKIEQRTIELVNQNEEYAVLNSEYLKTNKILKKAKEKAEESDRLKTAFFQNMSHEIRTPLNAIVGFAERINDPKITNEKRKTYSDIITKSSFQLLSIVSDVLTISSLETGQESICDDKVCLNNILNELFTIFSPQAEAKSLQLIVTQSLSNKQSELLIDKVKIKQILTNLLTNSIKFTHKGEVEFGCIQKGNSLEFFVRDSGIGIEQSKQELIFNRFVQANNSIQSNYGGTGLGLSICKGFVELMGGKIWVQSEVGEGSTFYFTTPYKPSNHEATAKINFPRVHKSFNSTTVLVADDQYLNFLYLEELLIELNCNVIHSKNGIEAVDACKENNDINIVLMDIRMPVMDGFTAAKLIKEFRPDLPILAQTAYATEQEIEEYGKAFDDYITKPITSERLLKAINIFLNNK